MTKNEERRTNYDFDAILFDMDGTLIDESASYREAIRLTAEFVLREPVGHDEVAEIKRYPGFNNDWDATWALVGRRTHGAIRVPDAADRGSHAYKRMTAVFQTYYLGHELWAQVSRAEPPFDWAEPLMARETALVSIETLDHLSSLTLGIATSRPRVEALMALRQHSLSRFFAEEVVVCSGDTADEKPHPAPLLELARRMGCRRPVYVGDTINDAIAAAAAGMPFIHIGVEPFMDKTVPVHHRVDSVEELPRLLTAKHVPSSVA